MLLVPSRDAIYPLALALVYDQTYMEIYNSQPQSRAHANAPTSTSSGALCASASTSASSSASSSVMQTSASASGKLPITAPRPQASQSQQLPPMSTSISQKQHAQNLRPFNSTGVARNELEAILRMVKSHYLSHIEPHPLCPQLAASLIATSSLISTGSAPNARCTYSHNPHSFYYLGTPPPTPDSTLLHNGPNSYEESILHIQGVVQQLVQQKFATFEAGEEVLPLPLIPSSQPPGQVFSILDACDALTSFLIRIPSLALQNDSKCAELFNMLTSAFGVTMVPLHRSVDFELGDAYVVAQVWSLSIAACTPSNSLSSTSLPIPPHPSSSLTLPTHSAPIPSPSILIHPHPSPSLPIPPHPSPSLNTPSPPHPIPLHPYPIPAG